MAVNRTGMKYRLANTFAVDKLVLGSTKKAITNYGMILIGIAIIVVPVPGVVPFSQNNLRFIFMILGMYTIMTSFMWWISKASTYIRKHHLNTNDNKTED